MVWLAMVVTAGAMLLTASQHALPGPGSDRATGAPSAGSIAAEVDPQEIRLVSGRAAAVSAPTYSARSGKKWS